MTKEEILAKLTARQQTIPQGISPGDYILRSIAEMHEVAAELLADKPQGDEVEYDFDAEVEIPATDAVAFIIMNLVIFALVIAGYSYYALTLFVLFLIIYFLIRGWQLLRP